MTRYNVLANESDGFLRSSGTVVTDAQEGSGGDQAFDPPQNDLTVLHAGQKFEPGDGKTYVTQWFQEYTITTPASTEMVTSACYKLHGLEHVPTGDSWSLEIREAGDWDGTDPVNGDFVGRSSLNNYDLMAEFPEIRTKSPKPVIWRAGTLALRTLIAAGGDSGKIRVFAHSNKQRLGFNAGGTGDEFVSVNSFEGAAGPFRPRLEYSTAVKSTLTRCSAGEVQLTDGTVAFLEFDGDVLSLRHRTNAGSETAIETVPLGLEVYQFTIQNGAQAFSLTRDDNDNLFIMGPSGAFSNGIACQAYVKGSGYSWQSRFAMPHQLPTYDQPVNQVIGAWHSVGTGAGYIVCAAAHMQGYSLSNQTVLMTFNVSALLNNTGIVGSGSLVVAQTDVASQYLGAPINACGAGLDVCAISGGRGVLAGATFDHGQIDSSENRGNVSVYSYTVASNGSFSSGPTKQQTFDTAGQVKADGNIRAKLMRVSNTRFALLCAGILGAYTYSSTGAISNIGSNPWLMNSGGSGTPLTAYPQNTSGTGAAHPQDAIYDSSTGKVFIYYPDQANSRRIMRTGFNVNNGLLDLTETQVETNTGPSGSGNFHVRTPRGPVDERFIQVHLGNRAGDGTLDTVHVGDAGLNVAPNAPILNTVNTFSAAFAKQVTWVYSDNNPNDSQSAFQLQIRDQSTSTGVLDTGKVVSANSSYTIAANTLSNNETYEWRVRTYDESDVVGAYSAYAAFSTTTVGVAEITDPAVDNAPGLASPTLDITWTFTASGLTQARYNVKVIRTDTGAQLHDSNYISGADVRTYRITGLISDVEQQIELRIEDNTGELSNTALRLVTPVFSGPDAPTISAEATADGLGIQVAITNPDPTGDLPAAEQNDIYRSLTGEETYIKIGETTPNSIFVDYGAAARTSYDYKVFAVAQGQTESEPVEGVSTVFYGVSIHDPLDAASTVRLFQYGRSNKSNSVSAPVTAKRFVGRQYPTFYFGNAQDESVNVQITLNDSDLEQWQEDIVYFEALAVGKTVMCYRDNRVRKVFGVITDVNISDADTGTEVTFTVNRAHYDETFG